MYWQIPKATERDIQTDRQATESKGDRARGGGEDREIERERERVTETYRKADESK